MFVRFVLSSFNWWTLALHEIIFQLMFGVGTKELHQLAGNVTWCQWTTFFKMFINLLGKPVIWSNFHSAKPNYFWGYALQVGRCSIPDCDGSMWREEICTESPEPKGSSVTWTWQQHSLQKNVITESSNLSICEILVAWIAKLQNKTGVKLLFMLCFETIWAQQGVFLGAMASSRMSWNALTLMPALPPRLHVGSGGVPLLWPQSQPLALSLGLMLGNVVQAGATCYSPLCQCFRGRKLHVMIPLLKMGKVKRESRMFWVERSAIADWIAKNRLPSQPFTTFVVRFGASTKQPKTAFFGEYRTWLNMVVQKGALQVVVATAAPHLVPPAAMVAVLKQNRHPPTLAAILETSMSTRGTFKAGPVNVCHLTLMSLLIHSFNVGSHPGIQVCREAFCKLLGIGSWRLVRTRRAFQGEDLRKYGILSLKYTTLWETQCTLWKFP